MTESPQLALDDLTGDAAILRVYRQVFAVLAREAGAMIIDPATLDVDGAILDAFAEAGSEGLAVEHAVAACRRWDAATVGRRFEVLREYGAISKVVDRPNERYHRAAFAPYVMLLFLRRMAAQGGQSELHQLLTLEQLNVKSDGATAGDGRESVARLTKVFRLLGNELSILAAAAPPVYQLPPAGQPEGARVRDTACGIAVADANGALRQRRLHRKASLAPRPRPTAQ